MVIRVEILSNLLGLGILNAFSWGLKSSTPITKTLFTLIHEGVLYITLNEND